MMNVNKIYYILGFTLAEVLITLGIIGIVAAMTIPTLISSYQDSQYKTAYKKAYADISQAFAVAIQDQSLGSRTGWYDGDATYNDWNVFRSSMKIAKDCTNGVQFYTPTSIFYDCWVDGEKVDGNAPKGGWYSQSLIDSSGRAWASYAWNLPIYFVDTNGAKGPNQFGKDRWEFELKTASGGRVYSGLPAKIAPLVNGDITAAPDATCCNYPPCYFKSWLYD